VRTTVEAANAVAAGAGGAVAPAVAALTDEVLRTTLRGRLKVVTAGLVLMALLGGGVGTIAFDAHSGPSRKESSPPAAQRRNANEGAAPLPQPTDPVDRLLVEWARATANWQTVAAEVQRIVWKGDEVPGGPAPFLQGQGETSTRASLYVQRARPAPGSERDSLRYSLQYLPGTALARPSPEAYHFERYVCTEAGSFRYVTAPADKVVRVYQLPPPADGKVADQNFLRFLFEVRAEEVKRRYHVTYVGNSPERPDQYHRLHLVPLKDERRAEFAEARVVLEARGLLPRQLWFRRPDGRAVTWNFLKAGANVNVPPAEFAPPRVPADWTVERAAAGGR
jgi:hypothetical protein